MWSIIKQKIKFRILYTLTLRTRNRDLRIVRIVPRKGHFRKIILQIFFKFSTFLYSIAIYFIKVRLYTLIWLCLYTLTLPTLRLVVFLYNRFLFKSFRFLLLIFLKKMIILLDFEALGGKGLKIPQLSLL